MALKTARIAPAPRRPATARVKSLRAAPRERPARDALVAALLADTESGVVLVGSDETIVDINPAGCRLLAVPAERARGRAAGEVVRTVLRNDEAVREAFRAARVEREAVLVTPDGVEVPVLLRSYRFGAPPMALLTFRDLTQMRRMQQELRRNERLATLGQLSAGVAHEIRNPLAGIGTSAQVLLRRFEPRDERARFVRVILDEVARLDRIVTSLLQYARPRTPELSARSLGSCIDRVLEIAADQIHQAGVEVEVDVAPRLAPVYIDADLVTQVLLNVTLNAIQAMPEGGTLRYEVRKLRRRRSPRSPGRRTTDPTRTPRDRSGWTEYQQIRVNDTGVGMPRGVLSKLFDPFFSTKPQGTGLGMSISQSIVQEHGGSIEVASREGHGTTVLLNFPVEKRHGERREPDSHASDAFPARR